MSFDSESAEAEWMYRYQTSAPAALGVTAARVGSGVVLHMRHDPISYWSQALGFTEPITEDLLDQILGLYRAWGAKSATLHFAPPCLPDDFPRMAAARGIVRAGDKMKVGGDVATVNDAASDFRIERVTEQHAAEFGELILTGFGAPGTPLSEMIANSVSDPCCRAFAAWDGDQMVAGASLLIHGDVGALYSGSTLADFRCRGAQSALISTRARVAREAGVRWLIAETASPAADRPNTSLNNMRRAGLKDLYLRPVWRWTAEG